MGLLGLLTTNNTTATTMQHSTETALLTSRQFAWLTRYIRVSLVVVWLMIVFQVIAYLIQPFQSLISGTAWIAAYGIILLWGRFALQQGQIFRVADIICGSQLLISVLAGLTNPEALPVLIQLPLIVLIAVLPFVSARRFWVILILSVLAIAAIITISILQPDLPVAASIRVNVLLITGLETLVILAMLVQYQRWLADLLEQSHSINLTLEATKANLELEVQQRTNELHEREQKYRRLFEESLDVIYLTSPDGRLLDINQAGLDLLGYTREEFDQLDMASDVYFDPVDRIYFQQLIAKHGIVKGLESRRRHKDGHILYVEESATAVRDAEGSIIAYQGFLHDITARKQVEAELEQSRERSRLTSLNSVPVKEPCLTKWVNGYRHARVSAKHVA
jgi:PAS domain S-box-containing protein